MKKKILTLAIAACIFALSIVGTSLAYFTDTEQFTNVFTAGNVDITLTSTSNTLNLGENSTGLGYHVYPGQSYALDTTISNVGSEDAYVGAIITLKAANIANFVTVAGESDNYPVAVRTLLAGLAKTPDYTVKYTATADTLTIYVVKNAALAKKTENVTDSCEIIDSIYIPAEWDHEEIEAFKALKLDVVAYATQTVGFVDANNRIAAENGLIAAFGAQSTDPWFGYATATVLG